MQTLKIHLAYHAFIPAVRGRRGRDRMVGSLIYNYMCYQCLSPLMLWVRIPLMARCTR